MSFEPPFKIPFCCGKLRRMYYDTAELEYSIYLLEFYFDIEPRKLFLAYCPFCGARLTPPPAEDTLYDRHGIGGPTFTESE